MVTPPLPLTFPSLFVLLDRVDAALLRSFSTVLSTCRAQALEAELQARRDRNLYSRALHSLATQVRRNRTDPSPTAEDTQEVQRQRIAAKENLRAQSQPHPPSSPYPSPPYPSPYISLTYPGLCHCVGELSCAILRGRVSALRSTRAHMRTQLAAVHTQALQRQRDWLRRSAEATAAARQREERRRTETLAGAQSAAALARQHRQRRGEEREDAKNFVSIVHSLAQQVSRVAPPPAGGEPTAAERVRVQKVETAEWRATLRAVQEENDRRRQINAFLLQQTRRARAQGQPVQVAGEQEEAEEKTQLLPPVITVFSPSHSTSVLRRDDVSR